MIRMITFAAVILLVSTIAAADDLWLNEIYTWTHTPDPRVVHLKFEIVGRLEVRESVTVKSEFITAFYSATRRIGYLPGYISKSTHPNWNHNFVGTARSNNFADAFPPLGGVGGMTLTYGDTTKVYCWGANISTDTTIGGDDIKCEILVDDENGLNLGAHTMVSKGHYNTCGTPPEGGQQESDFSAFLDSSATDDEGVSAVFETIGDLNVCPDGATCDALLLPQTLATHTHSLVEQVCTGDVVWLNEISISTGGSVSDLKIELEVVGRPAGSVQPAPLTLPIQMQFYSEDEDVGGVVEGEITLGLGWNGNWVYTGEVAGYGDAFPVDGGIGGMKITMNQTEVVYCWGLGVSANATHLGEEGRLCKVVVRSDGGLNDGVNTSVALARYNSPSTPRLGGSQGAHFEYLRSLSPSLKGGTFTTFGTPNRCDCCNDCHSSIAPQILAPYVYPSAPLATTVAVSSALRLINVTRFAGFAKLVIIGVWQVVIHTCP